MKSCITAVALNPAIDRTLTVPGFAAGQTNRVASIRVDPGGKGINVARVAKALGASVQVIGFLGQTNGNLITEHLAAQGIPAALLAVAGETRVNMKIIDPDTGALTEVNDPGFAVDATQTAALIEMVSERLAETAVLVLTGSLPTGVPAGIYRDLVKLAAAQGIPTILDADGEALTLALSAGPDLIKPNRAEAERLLGRSLPAPQDLFGAAAELLALGAKAVVISGGEEGAAMVTGSEAWWATPPAIEAGSTVGAGDSMVAGLAVAIARGSAPADALRLATAAGAATASLPGTQTCTWPDVEPLLPHVALTPIREGEGGA